MQIKVKLTKRGHMSIPYAGIGHLCPVSLAQIDNLWGRGAHEEIRQPQRRKVGMFGRPKTQSLSIIPVDGHRVRFRQTPKLFTTLDDTGVIAF